MLGSEPCSSFQAAAGLLLLTGMQCLIATGAGRSLQHHGVAAKLAADDSDRAGERSAAQHRLQQWRNVLDARNTWFFDLGSNAGWKLQETAGQRHAFVGPAPDWALGSRAVPTLEFDVVAQSASVRDELPRPAGGNFAAVPCKAGSASQMWTLSSGVKPGDSKPTIVKLGAAASKGGCWEIEACATGEGAAVNCNWGCKQLPKSGCASMCDCNGAWSLNANGTITSVMDGKCLQVSNGPGSVVNVASCTGNASQKFAFKPSGSGKRLEQCTDTLLACRTRLFCCWLIHAS
jgi:hypothetical protein